MCNYGFRRRFGIEDVTTFTRDGGFEIADVWCETEYSFWVLWCAVKYRMVCALSVSLEHTVFEGLRELVRKRVIQIGEGVELQLYRPEMGKINITYIIGEEIH